MSPLGNSDVDTALAAVLAREPLPPGHVRIQREGRRDLPDTCPPLIALYGKKRAGKTTLADMLARRYAHVRALSFSYPIIQEVNRVLAGSGHMLTDANKADADYRYLLQAWGQARRLERRSYWCDLLASEIRAAWTDGCRLVLAAGLREPYELEMITRLGGETWKIVRPSSALEDAHPIETALDHVPDDFFARVIVNEDDRPVTLLRTAVRSLERPRRLVSVEASVRPTAAD